MRRLAAGTVIAALVAVAVAVAASAGGGEKTSRLLFRAEFGGERLDRAAWRTCHWWSAHGCTIAGNDELEWYVRTQVRVADGQLRLVAQRRAVTAGGRAYPFVSGMVSSGPGARTAPRFAFRYGRAEMRARIPAGRGLWPAFWLLPADRESKPEIDVMEIYGDRPETVRMHLHYRDAGGRSRQRGRDWSGLTAGWHRFAIDWRRDRLTWLVDGVARWTVRGRIVPRERMYLVANLAVGGQRAGAPDAATRFPATFAIDWIRVSR